MKAILARMAFGVLLSLVAALCAGESAACVTRSFDTTTTIRCRNGETVSGVLLCSGSRGSVIVVDREERFIPAAEIVAAETVTPSGKSPSTSAAPEAAEPVKLKTFKIEADSGTLVVTGETTPPPPTANANVEKKSTRSSPPSAKQPPKERGPEMKPPGKDNKGKGINDKGLKDKDDLSSLLKDPDVQKLIEKNKDKIGKFLPNSVR